MRILKSKDGTTLTELLVSMLLFSILMVMIAGIVAPAFKFFIKMERLQQSEVILDTVITQLQGELAEANGYIKIYDGFQVSANCADNICEERGSDRGNAIEYFGEEGHIVLLTAAGLGETNIYRGNSLLTTDAPIENGRLNKRYYSPVYQNDGTLEWRYYYRRELTNGTLCRNARGVEKSFADMFYMGNYLQVEFAFPEGVANGADAEYLLVTVTLYQDPEMTVSAATQNAVVDLRYDVIRNDEPTAEKYIET